MSRPSGPRFPADAPKGGRLRRIISNVPNDFNWLTNNTTQASELRVYVANQFARRDRTNPDKWVPELAEKITANDDRTIYTIHLREGVMWHVPQTIDLTQAKYGWLRKPREMTAKDAAFYFELATDPAVEAGALKNYYSDLKKVEVIDRYTLRVEWRTSLRQSEWATIEAIPMPKWLYTRTEDGSKIPEDEVGERFNTHWTSRKDVAAGTGPYILGEVDEGDEIVLNPNRNYWRERPPIDGITYKVANRPERKVLMLRANEVDFVGLSPKTYWREVVRAGKDGRIVGDEYAREKVTRPIYYYLGWNADDVLFEDARVRRAMTHAFDRKEVLEGVYHGLGELMSGPYLPDHPANNPDVSPLAFDLKKASKLLDEAGWKDTDNDGVREKEVDGEDVEFAFLLLAYNKESVKKYLSMYAEDLEKIGVEMTPSFVSWPTMQKRMDERNFDAFTGGWALGWEIDPYQIWHSSQADVPKGSNRVGFRNDRADEIIETLRVTFDEDRRRKLLREFHAIVHEQQPYTFMHSIETVYVWRKRLRNVVFQKYRPVDLSIPWHIRSSDE